MYRLAVLASRTKVNRAKSLNTTPKRKFGDAHPVDEHPYFNENNSTLYTKYAYTRHPANTTYGEKFPHPMNYQGHVPVTPTSFARTELIDEPMFIEQRVARTPAGYIFDSFLIMGVMAYFASRFADGHQAIMHGHAAQPEAPLPYIHNFIKRRVQLQNEDRITGANLPGVKNVYQTEEFNTKLQSYLAERSQVVNQ